MPKFDKMDFRTLDPRPAVESNWKLTRYTPEVMFYGGQWVVGPVCSSHEEATKVAEAFSNQLKTLLIETGMEALKNLIKSKE